MSFRRSLGLALILGGAALVAWVAPVVAQRPADLKGLARQSLSKLDGDVTVPGVREPVEIIRDKWGVTHIYAKNQDDLFFAQGYAMGQDRLWQIYMWRMEHEGRLSEILGPAAFARDRQTRLLMYRGPFDNKEWTSYHPDGKKIFTAFANGLNAYITQHLDNLPVEFKLTGLKPDLWKPETALLRVAGMGDANGELTLARLIARVGVKEAMRQRLPDPWSEIAVPEGLDLSLITDEVVNAGRGGGRGALPKPALVAPYNAMISAADYQGSLVEDLIKEPGSNNWVIGGKYTTTGKPLVANDPHREVTNPSLRYIVHLVAPGWNVIGSGEPPFVGVALGHNERVAWGLTIAGNDQTDVFVEEINPANANEVKYNGAWEPLKIVRDEIKVKGEAPRVVEFKISRHGPIFFEDAKNHRAYALKSAFNEPGTASYLGGLRLDQAPDCKEFLDRAMYWKAPTENLICGDVDGNITVQSSALTPNRRGFDGRLPVPGTGKYEWDGFRAELPRRVNPQAGYIATANNNINTTGSWPPVVFKTLNTVPTDRITRVEYVINNLLKMRKFTIEDSKKLQHDPYSLRASFDQDVFKGWSGKTADVEKARAMVVAWDSILHKDSAAAAIYETWRTTVDAKALEFFRPPDEKRPLAEAGLVKAIAKLTETQGADWSAWRWGRMHNRPFPHPFVKEFDLPTVERDGGTGAVMADGASYREIMDTADWDRSVVTNVPGQSGQPESEFYGNLLPLWDKGEYFPMVYSRAKVDQNAAHKLNLRPATGTSSAQK
ncbi:MAG: penicillin acylase family protein [Acidobacteria bacterium]|nr:penicillin acylase family protein [Acidobacteriota bacterium]